MESDKILNKIITYHANKYNTNCKLVSKAPGRVNIIGEHTDYNYGLAMPVAVSRYVYVSISLNSTKSFRVYSDSFKEDIYFDLNEISDNSNWHIYVSGCIKEVYEIYKLHKGLDICIFSNLPIGRGVSSSAALEVALVNGIMKVFNINEKEKNIIKLCQSVDEKYLRIKSGTLDQTASQLSKKDHLLKIDFSNDEVNYIPYRLNDCSWIVIDSMIRRELVNTQYAKRVDECEKALLLLSNYNGEKKNINNLNEEDMNYIFSKQKKLFNRIKHVLDENSRVIDMEKLISKKDLNRMGKVLMESHFSLRNLYSASCLEIDYLIDISTNFDEWYGGRIMGGGFGGSTINLIKKGYEKKYCDYLFESYKKKYNIALESNVVEFCSGVEIILY